jgi:GntR family transcriptional regulator, transcriptional repressor for pyruvate dehydrogenase complex
VDNPLSNIQTRRDGRRTDPADRAGAAGSAKGRRRLAPIPRTDVFREVLERLDDHIDSNQLGPGDRLPSDRDIAVALGVSRPIVRQALKVLEGLGRVSSHQGAGTFVRDASHRVAVGELTRGLTMDRSLLRDLLPIRVQVEVMVLRAAFLNRGPGSYELLEEALKDSASRASTQDITPTLDLAFEATLGRLCGNEILRRLQGLIHEIWVSSEISVGLVPDNLNREHIAIFEAFRNGDLERAVSLMHDHLGTLADVAE